MISCMISYVIYDIYSLQRRISFRRSPAIQSRMERMTQTDKWILMRSVKGPLTDYICPVAIVLGRAPLIPCLIGGNRHPTIPHSFRNDPRLGDASADTQRERGNGSRLYEEYNFIHDIIHDIINFR